MDVIKFIQTGLLATLCVLLYLVYNNDHRQERRDYNGKYELQTVPGMGVFLINKTTGKVQRFTKRGDTYFFTAIHTDPWEIVSSVPDKKEDIFDQVGTENQKP